MLAALLITASLAAPATLSDARPHRPVVVQKAQKQKQADVQLAQASLAPDPNAPDHEPTFVEQYLSYQLAPTAAAPVKDGMVLSHVLGYLLPCGGLWGPLVLIDGAEFSGDVFITYLLSGILWFVAISVVSTVTVGVGLLLFLAYPYLNTTATLNAVDRQLKAKGYKPPPPGKTTTGSPPGNTPPPTDTPPPSYAY